ncbi:UNVERIFIED_CONTAM: CRISPR-associated protein Csx10 [Acetivibrio alkalicellulosi]
MIIEVKLNSDLCVGSGEGQANIIDTDVVLDDFGIPYVPAKRLKGCLKEAAMEIRDAYYKIDDEEYNEIQSLIYELFGTGEKQGKLKIQNGIIKEYDSLEDFIKKNNEHSYLHRQNLIEYFTTVRVQTKVDEDGVAEDNSLRSIRVINKKIAKAFYFKINKLDQKEISFLSDCCKVLKFIGSNRTRGLGNVSCNLFDSERESANSFKPLSCVETNSKEKLVINYNLSLLSDVAVSKNGINSDDTLTFIPGSSLYGYFANQFIKSNNNKRTREFDSLFLKDDSILFSNAYISDDEGGSYFPIPASIMKNKNEPKKKDIIDYTKVSGEDKKGLKPLKGTYINFKNSNITFKKPDTILHYHHRRPSDKGMGHVYKKENASVEETGTLFNYNAIKKGQEFKGSIILKKDQLDTLMNLVPEDGIINIGKSKTAEYSHVKISFEDALNEEIYNFKSGDIFSIVLTSPALLLDAKKGVFSCNPELLALEIKKELELLESDGEFKIIQEKSLFKFTSIGGFNIKWGLLKQQYEAFNMGTVITFEYNGSKEINLPSNPYIPIGVKCNEGYGQWRILATSSCYKEAIYKADFKTNDADYSVIKETLTKLKHHVLMDIVRMEASRYGADNNFFNKFIPNSTVCSKLADLLSDCYIKSVENDFSKNVLILFSEALKKRKETKGGLFEIEVNRLKNGGLETLISKNYANPWVLEYLKEIEKEPVLINKLFYEFMSVLLGRVKLYYRRAL